MKDGNDVRLNHEHDEQPSEDPAAGIRDVPSVLPRESGSDDRGFQETAGGVPESSEEDLPEANSTQREAELQQVIEASLTTSGPLPDPRLLQMYDDVLPGAAERIVRMAESQTVQVSDREDRIADAQISRDHAGQRWAGLLAVVCIAFSAVFGFRGDPVMAGIMVGMPMVILIGSFLQGRPAHDSHHADHDDWGSTTPPSSEH